MDKIIIIGIVICACALLTKLLLSLIGGQSVRADDTVQVKSGRAVETYDITKYFQEDRNRIQRIENFFRQIEMSEDENKCYEYKLRVLYVSPAGRSSSDKIIVVTPTVIQRFKAHPELLMTKTELNQAMREQAQAQKQAEKEQAKAMLEDKQHKYYNKVNDITDLANNWKDLLIIKNDKNELDKLMQNLFDRTINSIKKIKSVDSEEWDMIGNFISNTFQDTQKIIKRNQEIMDYYNSDEFKQLKDTCNALMGSQKDFNDYIEEKAQSISTLFGTKVIRNETINEDKSNYIRPYKKTITPFTAEVSNAVFASAENNPMEYIVKYFYPNKANYPTQIQKLQLLIGELETLKEAKQIIENYKKDYQQYLTNVPSFILENDEDGFYAKLGFANISESVLTVEYKFTYTSNGGMAQRSFTVPMTEDIIIALIDTLESKLTMESFTNEQRALMTQKLRNRIKERDDYTCQICGNSTHKEPNLLLEIDHIKPVSKGGCTVEDNLQTLCWKCNRAKSNKM